MLLPSDMHSINPPLPPPLAHTLADHTGNCTHFELLVPKEAVDDPEAKDVGHLRVPLDDDRVVLPVRVLDDHLKRYKEK